ncbi:MAG: membrane protein [Chloroflexi bacterium CSP1-4]|nr:MAG: membrane protein [Chloroflexi bacterium CSP1-4]
MAGAGAIVWFGLIGRVDLAAVNDLGLVSVLPPLMYVGMALVAIAYGAMLARADFPTWLAVGLVVLTIAMLYGLAPAIEGELRFSPAWRHLGLVEFMSRNGAVQPSLDAYHNWPGLFGLAAFLTSVTGVSDLNGLAMWAPVWFNLAFLAPLALVLSALTDDRRILWLAIWLFYLTDWIGQDYFAPQALGFLLFLVVVAMLLRWLGHGELAEPSGAVEEGRLYRLRQVLALILDAGPMRAAALSPRRRAALMAALLVIYVFVVGTHQLTPFFLAAVTLALVLLRRVPWATLPVLMAMTIAAWVAFLAVAFLIGHFQNVAGYVGTLAESLAANLTSRLQGSPDHVTVIYVRIASTLFMWGLAVVGVIRRLLQGRWDVTALVLALAPFPLFLVQAYGGEMLLRIYLFALPFVAFFVACAVLPRSGDDDSPSLATVGIVSVLGIALMGGLMVTRYGNERLEHFSSDEVAAVAELYRVAPPGSLLVALTPNLPWKSVNYEQYRYRPSGDDSTFGDLERVLSDMSLHDGDVFLILSRSQQAYAEMILGARPGAWEAFRRALLGSGKFRLVYLNPDAVIARFTE